MNNKNMGSVFFYPWVGKNYEKGIEGKKILILGESHICGGCENQCGDTKIKDESCRNLTSDAVRTYLNYKKGNDVKHEGWMRTYTVFSNVFLNRQLESEEVLSFWDSILFYNYVQYSTTQSRVSPMSKEFINSKNAFFEILAEFKPDLIIAWGARLWDQLPDGGEYEKLEETTLINNGKGLYYYTEGNRKIPIMYVNHPSSSIFSYSTHDIIREAIKRA